MIILIVTTGFFPGKKYGGPPVSVDNFCTLMTGIAECYIITHNHDLGEQKVYSNITEGWNDRGNAKVKYVSNAAYNAATFEDAIIELKPDYIYLQSLFQKCVFDCMKLAKKHNVKVFLAPRGELCSGAFKKKYKKLPYIAALRVFGLLKNVSFQSTSDEESTAIIRYLGVNRDRIYYLTNIPSIPSSLPSRELKESGNGRFVFISRILWKKNLLKAINLLEYLKGSVIFDIYGPKEDENYWKECEAAIKKLPKNVKVEYKGVLSHDEIHKTFNHYDAFLFPTLSENYGHVIAEALVTGCIPIISNQTPWTDMNDKRAGWALPLENENGFVKALQEVVDMNEDDIMTRRKSISSYLEDKFKLEQLKKEYKEAFSAS